MSHADLIARMEKLTGPDRLIDQDIYCELGLATADENGILIAYRAPDYSASIDAAVALINQIKHLHGRKVICMFAAGGQITGDDADYDPRSLPDNSQTVGWMAHVAFYEPTGGSKTYGPERYSHATNPAIALLIALLRALLALQGEQQ